MHIRYVVGAQYHVHAVHTSGTLWADGTGLPSGEQKRGTANCKPWVLRILVDESQKKILKLIQKK